MNMATTLIEKLRKRRVDPETSTYTQSFESYRDMLIRICNDDEVDPAEAEEILKVNGKTDEQLVHDTDIMRRRLEAQKQLQDAFEASEKLPPLQAKCKKLVDELNEHYARLNPQILQADFEFRMLQATAGRDGLCQNTLNDTVLDPRLISRKKQNDVKRRALWEKKCHLTEQLDGRTPATCSYNVAICKRQLKAIEQRLEMRRPYFVSDAEEKDIAQTKRVLVSWEEQVQKFESQLKDIDKQLAECETESQKLREESLEP